MGNWCSRITWDPLNKQEEKEFKFKKILGRALTNLHDMHLETNVPALHILVLLFHICQVESHAQPRSASGPDETVHACLTVKLLFSQLEAARIWTSAFPIHQDSIHKAEGEKRNNNQTTISDFSITSQGPDYIYREILLSW